MDVTPLRAHWGVVRSKVVQGSFFLDYLYERS
jgi:hypothetical protein